MAWQGLCLLEPYFSVAGTLENTAGNFLYIIVQFSQSVHILMIYDMVAKSIGDDTNYKQLLILPFDN